MRKPVEPGSPSRQILSEEEEVLQRVHDLLGRRAGAREAEGVSASDLDRDLIALRDQLADEKQEDIPSLVEQMTRVASLASGRRGRATGTVDIGSPYFAHLRLQTARRGQPIQQDVLIGKYGLIDRDAGVQIVDWRDAPVSQVYYRYDEGDDYEEEVGDQTLRGVVLARRNTTVDKGRLRRVGCPQGTFVASGDGRWFELAGDGVALLSGGVGTAARAPRATSQPHGKRRFESARPMYSDNKQLPEIAALIDRDQFALITRPSTGVVIIQGGAGSGKTTVALHRIAFLVFEGRSGGHSFKPSHCLFVVPSEALARYVAGVLPALGVHGVPVTTYRSWSRTLRKRLVPDAPDAYAEDTPPVVTRLKKHPLLGRLLEAKIADEVAAVAVALEARLGAAAEPVLALWRARANRPPLPRLRGLRSALDKREHGLTPHATTVADQVLRQASVRLRGVRRIVFELLTDRGRLAALAAPPSGLPAETPVVSAAEVDELVRWASRQLDEHVPQELEGIDEERMLPIDGRPLDDGEAAAAGRLDPEDDTLLLRAYQLLWGALTRMDGEPLVYDHIAIDEAQDLSVLETRLLYDALDERRSLTICGDVAQRVIFDNAFSTWEALAHWLGIPDSAVVRPLRLAYRSTAQVMRLALHVLGELAPPEASQVEAREGAEVELHEFPGMGEAVAFVGDALRSLCLREPAASVAVISRHGGQADAWYAALQRAEVPSLRRVRRQDFAFTPGVDVTDAAQCKGLEFDYVILVDVNQSSYPATTESRHLLHIGATRATHQLWMIATGPVSELVAGWNDGAAEESSEASG